MKKTLLLCDSEVFPVKHWCYYLSYTALVKHMAGEPCGAKAIGQVELKTTPQLKRYPARLVTSLFPSSLLYIMTLLRAHFPPLQPLPALHQPLVKLWWLQSHFLDWLSLGSVEVQQPPHLHLPVWHWDTAWAFTWRREKKIKSRWNCRAAPDGQKSQGCFCRLQQARPNRNQEIITASSSLASKLVFYSIFKFEGELFRVSFFCA